MFHVFFNLFQNTKQGNKSLKITLWKSKITYTATSKYKSTRAYVYQHLQDKDTLYFCSPRTGNNYEPNIQNTTGWNTAMIFHPVNKYSTPANGNYTQAELYRAS